MVATVAEARGDKNANMHCSKGHTFKLKDAYVDDYGTWCPQCTRTAHSYHKSTCGFCNPKPTS